MKVVGEPDAGNLQVRFDEGALGNARALLYSTVKERRETVTELINNGFTIKSACRLSGYTRSLVYYTPRERNTSLDPDISERINEIIVRRPSYGTRRVAAMIRMSGITVNRKKVRRHMKELNLLHQRGKRFRKNVPRIIVASTPNMRSETSELLKKIGYEKLFDEGNQKSLV